MVKKCRFNDEKICTVLNDCLASCPMNMNRQRIIPCEDCIHSYDGKPCRRWINCIRYEHMKKQNKHGDEYDLWQWYRDHFRADCSGAPDIICNG